MSFPDPTPPSSNSFVTLPYAGGGDMGGFWPPPQMNQENLEMYSQFENEPPFKRTRSSEINPGASIQNPKVNPPNLPGKGSNHIFYKTRMCVKFMEGNCRNGEHCTFAHGVEDLREPPPNWQDIIREKDRAGPGNWNSNDHQKVMHRMKICKKFYNGEECPYGERCNFLHERAPQFIKNDMGREQRESSAISIGTTGSMMGRRSDSNQFEINQHASVDSDAYRIKPMFLKTKICSKWEITGQCPFGERCNFAHGQSELKAHASRTEMEATTNFAPAPIKPLAPGLDPSSANAVPGVPVNEQQQPQEGKKFLKWKLTKKISPIYADWIDGFVPPHLLFGKGEDEF